MMKKATQLEFSITIGTENEAQELYDMSVVTATYKMGGKRAGFLWRDWAHAYGLRKDRFDTGICRQQP